LDHFFFVLPKISMNILIIRPNLIGGAGEYVLRLAGGLTKKGHKVVIGTGPGPWASSAIAVAKYYDHLDFSPRLTWGRLRIPNLPGMVISTFRLAQIIRRENIDIINSHHRFAALIGNIVAKCLGVPLLNTMHEFMGDYKFMTNLSFGQFVIVPSAIVKDQVIEKYVIPAEIVQVVPFGVKAPPPLTDESRQNLIADIGLDDQHPIIGCVARLEKVKGQVYLLKAISLLRAVHPKAQFVFVGGGQDLDELRTLSSELNIQEMVHFLGHRQDVSDLMAIFDIKILPSVSEMLPIVLLEALVQGTPVVASEVGGIPEIVQDKFNGLLVPPRDVPALTDAILKLLDDPELVVVYGKAGKRTIEQKFSHQQFVDQTEQLFRQSEEVFLSRR
jgi:glycosyltransferase involved in cell wall biosynthesis